MFRRRRRWSVPRTRRTGTTRRTSRCSWPSPLAARHVRWPRWSRRIFAPSRGSRPSKSRDPGSSTSHCRRLLRAHWRGRSSTRAGTTAAPTRWPRSGSTSSSSRRTRPAPSTSVTRAGPHWATRCGGCSKPQAPMSPASTTSTTPACRCSVSQSPCWPRRTASRRRKVATRGSTSTSSRGSSSRTTRHCSSWTKTRLSARSSTGATLRSCSR